MTSENKNGIRLAMVEINKLPRFDLCWEWMEEKKDGEYVKISDIKKALIEKLKESTDGTN